MYSRVSILFVLCWCFIFTSSRENRRNPNLKLFMKCGELKENISGPISVTDISKFTGDTNEDSVVSGPVCQPNITETGVSEIELYWQFEGTNIPRATTEEGDRSGWIAVIYADGGKLNL
ncbi:hypothetical protein GBAR_LOCUS20485, partial [Geodia barretti]